MVTYTAWRFKREVFSSGRLSLHCCSMISRRYIHVLGCSCIFLFIVVQLLPALDFFIHDDQELAIHAEDLPATTHSEYLIPPIVHQVFHKWGDDDMRPEWQEARQSCIQLHPDYTFVLWNDSASRQFLEDHYAWFLPTYNNYRYPIQRVDTIRLFALLKYGGIYVDVDQGCRGRLDALRLFQGLVSGNPRSSGIANGIMAFAAQHPFLELVTASLPSYDWNWLSPYLTIVSSTGSHMLSFQWKKYRGTPASRTETGRIRKCPPSLCGVGENQFFIDGPGKTWYTWDTLFFLWESKHIFLATVLNLTLVLTFSALTWSLLWTTMMRARRCSRRTCLV